jgi:hypothetical protein
MIALDAEPVGGVILVTALRTQAKVVPVVAEVPVYETNPEQFAVIDFVVFNLGLGFTVTLIVSGLEHPFALRVKIYRTIIGAVVVFLKVSVILFPFPGVAVVVMPVTDGLVQEKLVPEVALVAV